MKIQPILTTPEAALSKAPQPPFTLADAQRHVGGWIGLSDTRRRDLASCLSSVAAMMNQPPAAILLTPQILRATLFDRTAAHYGLSKRTLCNIRCALKVVLVRLEVVDPGEGTFTADWDAQLALLERLRRVGLTAFARFCSARDIAPAAISPAVLLDYEAWLTTRTLSRQPLKTARAVRTGWNQACARVPGWVGQPLAPPQSARDWVLPLDAFPNSFRADLVLFGRRLKNDALDPLGDDDDADDTAPLPGGRTLRDSTVAGRQAQVRWAATAVVASGVPVEEVTSLASLLTPLTRAKEALRYLRDRRDRAGGRQKAAGHHVAEVLRIIARHHLGLAPGQVAQIRRWAKPVALKYDGMTERNERNVHEMMRPERLERLLALPDGLMQAARALHETAPNQARTLAMRAVAIGILTRAPIRLANLAGLRLDRHFHRPDPRRGTITQLRISEAETKNRREISLPVSPRTAQLIDEWVAYYRPATPGHPYLFPGHGVEGQPIGHQGLRDAVKETLRHHIGTALSPHQFRHLAAHLYLEAHPGHFEAVRQMLGHKTVATTIRHYSGTQTEGCMREYHQILEGRPQLLRGIREGDGKKPLRTPRKGER